MSVRERPILFSVPMVRALMELRKTQTRRVVAKPDEHGCLSGDCPHWDRAQCAKEMERVCPFGVAGDRLWVRERWRADDYVPSTTIYAADASDEDLEAVRGIIRWKPGIHLPRSRARILLELTSVGVQRLQQITCGDLRAEGAPFDLIVENHRWYRHLWDSLNGTRGFAWERDPWVWVVSFKVLVATELVPPEGVQA